MIIKDYRKKKITTEEFENMFYDNQSDDWDNLAKQINDEQVDVSLVDINKLLDDKSVFWNNLFWADSTFKAYLSKINPESISKATFSKLLTLEDGNLGYKNILKNIVMNTNKFNDMSFYDYEDNNYDKDITKKRILSLVKDIREEDLYQCHPSLLFKIGDFDPILYTCLNSPNEYDEEYYENVDYRVALV